MVKSTRFPPPAARDDSSWRVLRGAGGEPLCVTYVRAGAALPGVLALSEVRGARCGWRDAMQLTQCRESRKHHNHEARGSV